MNNTHTVTEALDQNVSTEQPRNTWGLQLSTVLQGNRFVTNYVEKQNIIFHILLVIFGQLNKIHLQRRLSLWAAAYI